MDTRKFVPVIYLYVADPLLDPLLTLYVYM